MKRLRAIEFLATATLGAVVATACGDAVDQSAGTVSDDPLVWGESYVRSAAVGRLALEESLVETDNGYAVLRLANYGPGRAWNLRPIADPPTRAVERADIGSFDQPWATSTGEFSPLGELSDWSHDAVLAYGKAAFERYPLGIDQAFAHALDKPADLDAFGLWVDEQDRVGGLVRVQLGDEQEAFAPTCATCHASVVDGVRLNGRPNADFDYDAMALHGMSGPESYPPTRWGAGSVDVTADQVVNPVAMADLRAVRHQRNLHWAGTLDNSLPALTVRIETLIMTSLGDTRPPREVAFAIAYYLWNLGSEGRPGDDDLPGAETFESRCSSCHGGDGSAGPPVAAEAVGTDARVARSTMRGLDTPVYRVPSLWKAGSRGQYLHDGRVASLEELLDPDRLDHVPGHAFGTDLRESARDDLIEFVRSIGGAD